MSRRSNRNRRVPEILLSKDTPAYTITTTLVGTPGAIDNVSAILDSLLNDPDIALYTQYLRLEKTYVQVEFITVTQYISKVLTIVLGTPLYPKEIRVDFCESASVPETPKEDDTDWEEEEEYD